ncbi:isocitrate lyase/PEP mutase family protein [Hafnia psychrotolerans]|uniref:Phosphonomutase n=1 Tax=Hafnia psychrotolerans TaxID=1477018 RepID=A0ABQ1GUD9_9GAMM|nr:isocitrate lyase/phosphoenolpyruvate mutase family protein [Hafnia psychrotolerans]GGA50601.1 phosphonomutase [Hafnia psychrotolerans]
MSQQSKALGFALQHQKHKPVMLYNIWDAGSAQVIEQTGATAIATGSWSCAAAQGYQDGEEMPFSALLHTVQRIASSVSLPLTVDFETGYGTNKCDHLAALLQAGAVGINVEDQLMGLSSLNAIPEQCQMLTMLRKVAESQGVALFINARTDIFLQAADTKKHPALMDEAKKRLMAYQDAGASGFFAPGLSDPRLIAELCAFSPLPVNIMVNDVTPPVSQLTELGVSRISVGPRPYIELMAHLKKQALAAI